MQVALDFFEGNGMFLFISLVIPSALFALAALGFIQDKQWTQLVFWTIALIVWSWLVISIYWGNFSRPCLIQGPHIECEIVERPVRSQRGLAGYPFQAQSFPPKKRLTRDSLWDSRVIDNTFSSLPPYSYLVPV